MFLFLLVPLSPFSHFLRRCYKIAESLDITSFWQCCTKITVLRLIKNYAKLLLSSFPLCHYLKIEKSKICLFYKGFVELGVDIIQKSMQNLSSYHNKKNGRGCCKPSEIKAFKIFLNQDLHLLYI